MLGYFSRACLTGYRRHFQTSQTVTTKHNILHDVSKHLPPFLNLLADPDSDLFYYYQHLDCTTYLERERYIIVVILPLLDIRSTFDVFHAFATDVPHVNSSMSARYSLEFEHFAISKDRTSFVILSATDYLACTQKVHFCKLQSAIFSVQGRELCVLALFLNKSDQIRQTCKTKLVPNVNLPQALPIKTGKWIITSQFQLTLTVLCRDDIPVQTVSINPPLQVVLLAEGCQGHSPYFTLPPYLERSSSKVKHLNLIEFHNVSDKIWKPVDRVLALFDEPIKIPELLANVTTANNIQDLVWMLRAKVDSNKTHIVKESSNRVFIIVLVAVSLFLLITVMIVVVIIIKCKVRWPYFVNYSERETQVKSNEAIELKGNVNHSCVEDEEGSPAIEGEPSKGFAFETKSL